MTSEQAVELKKLCVNAATWAQECGKRSHVWDGAFESARALSQSTFRELMEFIDYLTKDQS